jgi:2-polyprenyl-3-methyl-5-hydroxy-6-metoxy-1,4-benzoquinol methylase
MTTKSAPRNENLDPVSLERIIPDQLITDEATGSETLRLHVERYKFASENLVPGGVLDIACGVGYGTAILADNCAVTRAVGVDVSSAAVEYACRQYASDRVSFLCSGATEFHSAMQFENIVSLETIEHVEDPHKLFEHLVSLLNPGGRLIASVPVTPSVDANPHHKTNFSSYGFRKMGANYSLDFVRSMQQVQPFNPVAIATRKEARSASLRHNLPLFYLRNPSHLGLRLWSTLRDGFVNKYLTVVWQRPG